MLLENLFIQKCIISMYCIAFTEVLNISLPIWFTWHTTGQCFCYIQYFLIYSRKFLNICIISGWIYYLSDKSYSLSAITIQFLPFIWMQILVGFIHFPVFILHIVEVVNICIHAHTHIYTNTHIYIFIYSYI